jgi:hypothetical protein
VRSLQRFQHPLRPIEGCHDLAERTRAVRHQIDSPEAKRIDARHVRQSLNLLLQR